MTAKRGGPPERVGALITKFLRARGHEARMAQTGVLDEWPRVVGPQIARISEAVSISADGTLQVAVSTNAWMSELTLHEPEFLERLNAGSERPLVRRIRWHLRGARGNP